MDEIQQRYVGKVLKKRKIGERLFLCPLAFSSVTHEFECRQMSAETPHDCLFTDCVFGLFSSDGLFLSLDDDVPPALTLCPFYRQNMASSDDIEITVSPTHEDNKMVDTEETTDGQQTVSKVVSNAQKRMLAFDMLLSLTFPIIC